MNEKATYMEVEQGVSLRRLWGALLNRIWLISLVSVLSAVLIFAGTFFFITPKYESSAMFYVNNSNLSLGNTSLSITSGDLSTSRNLVDSYIVLLNTRETLVDVIDYAGVSYTYNELREMITAAAVNETEIFQVTVTSPDPQEAERIASAIAYILPKRISTIIDGTSARVADAAIAPSAPSSPSYVVNTLVGFLLGFLVTIGIIALREIVDTTIREEKDISQTCKHPILASVPDMTIAGKSSGYQADSAKRKTGKYTTQKLSARLAVMGPNISFAASEAYKLLRTKLQFSFADENDCHIIGISSALSGEGKSLTAVNLAYTLSQLNKKVLLVDCDMRRPTLAEKLGIQKYPGLSNYLTRQCHLNEVVQVCEMNGSKSVFHVITAGQNPPNPVELLSSARMKKAMDSMRQAYDYVILDLPPVGEVSDAMAVAKETDGILLVVRQNYCDRNVLAEAVSQFDFIKAKTLGVVFNYTSESGGRGYYKKYYKGYAKSYEKSDRKVSVSEKDK